MGKEKKKRSRSKTVYEKKYTQEDVSNALKAVKKGMSTRRAAATFKVPRSTLYAKHKGILPVEGVKGPSTYLTAEEEKLLVNWIFYCGERGFPVTKFLLLQCVQKLVTETERKTPFKNNQPGRHWWNSFCRRHPEVSSRVAQNLNMNRALVSEEALNSWFCEVKEYLKKLDLLDIDPSRVFNLDESAFFLVPKGDSVLARRGSKSVYKVVHGDEKESITVLFTVNAKGTLIPPFILYWYERIPALVTSNLPKGWLAGNTERGWMTAESFFNYISTQFYPWLVKNKIQFPVILFVDGHVSHLTLCLAQFCKAKQIELIALYPNATHILQPLDVAVFHPLKSKWKKTVDEWRIENGSQKLKREHFAPVLKRTLDAIPNLPNIIQNGFRTCGLLPFSSEAVDFNVLNKKKKKNGESTKHVSQEISAMSTEEEDAKNHLKYIEQRLNPDTLEDFEQALSSGSFKISNSTDEGLFRYWLDTKRLSGENVRVSSVSTNEDSGQDTNDVLVDLDSVADISQILDSSNLEIVIVPEEDGSDFILDAKCLDVVEARIESSKLSYLTNNYTQFIDVNNLLSEDNENKNEKAMESNNVTGRKTEEAPKLCNLKESIEQPFDTLDSLDQSLQDDQNSNVSESGVITVEMTENVTKSHSVMPEGLQPNVNINEQISNTSPVTDNLIQNQMSDELQDDQNSNVSESSVITVEMTENVTKSHSVMPEGLQSNVNIDEQISNTSPVTDNLIQNQMSDELQDVHTKTNENGAMKNIPSPLRKSLVWPADIMKNKKNKKKPARKVSTVLTSEEWQKQQLQIQEEKLRKQKEIEERKKLREEAKKRKAEEKQIKKAALEEKKKLDQEIKRLMAQKKKIRIKQKKVD